MGRGGGPPGGTILAELWDELDGVRWSGWNPLEDEAVEWVGGTSERASTKPPALRDLVSAALLRSAADEERRKGLLGTCRAAALGRVRRIVSNTHRSAYDRAAAAAVACAEGFAFAGWSEKGRLLLAGLREEFPRHSAFKRSLADHEARSSLLGSGAAARSSSPRDGSL